MWQILGLIDEADGADIWVRPFLHPCFRPSIIANFNNVSIVNRLFHELTFFMLMVSGRDIHRRTCQHRRDDVERGNDTVCIHICQHIKLSY